jgi:MFS family permease
MSDFASYLPIAHIEHYLSITMALKSLLPSALRVNHVHTEATQPPRFLKFRSSRFFIILTVSVAIFTDIFLYGLIVPVLPFALTTRASIPSASIQHWTAILLAIYSAGLLTLSPVMGYISDLLPTRRLLMLVGLVVLTGSTFMLMLGTTIAMFVAGRILQGSSAAVVWTTGLALLADTVGQNEVGRAMGIVSLAYSVGILLGPLLGGVVYAARGYYAVFYTAFGVIGVDVILRVAFIERKVAVKWLPNPSTTLSTSPTIETLEMASPTSHEPPPPATGAGFTAPQTETSSPTSPPSRQHPPILTLLSSKRLLAAFWGILVCASLMTAFDSTLPLYAQETFGFNSLGSGLLFLALVLPSATGPIVGTFAPKILNPKPPSPLFSQSTKGV